MLEGVNDSVADAKALVKLIKGIPSKINLIPFNPWPEVRLISVLVMKLLISLQKLSCVPVMHHPSELHGGEIS